MFAPHFRGPSPISIEWKIRGALLLTVLYVGSACSTTQYYLEPAASDTQDVFYVSGIPAMSEVLSYAEDQFVFVGVRGHTNSELLVLQLYVANETHDSLNVLPDKIQVLGTSGGDWNTLRVWDAFEYMRHVEAEQATARVIAAIVSGLEAANAGRSSTQQTGLYSDPYGQPLGSYSGSTTTYDYSKVEEAQSRNDAERRAMLDSQRSRISFLDVHLLKRTTLFPERDVFGLVFVVRELYDRYMIRVPIGDRHVELAFTLTDL